MESSGSRPGERVYMANTKKCYSDTNIHYINMTLWEGTV